MDENKLKHLSSWNGNAFINRYGSYAPWYDDKADYNTNAKSYYDYLARINQYLKIMQETINRLIDRDLKFEDTNTIDFTQIGKWIEQDVMTVTANVKISSEIKKKMIGYLQYELKNSITENIDGLFAPDYTKVIQDLKKELDNLKFTNDKSFVFYLDGKVRDKINYNQDLLPDGVDLSSTNEEVDKAYKALQDSDIYKIYDDLQQQNKKYSQVTTWGYTDDGRPLKYYVFEARNKWHVPIGVKGISRFDDYNNQQQSAPVFFCTSAQHGNEKANVWGLTIAIREIVNGESDIDRFIRDNYDLVILPMCNPYGFNHNLRNNENGININRNYPYKWEEDQSDDKGSAPFSEKSAQFINSVRNAYSEQKYKNGMAMIDFHDFNDQHFDDGRFLWVGSNDRDFRQSVIKTGDNIYDLLTSQSQLLKDNIKDGWLHLGSTGVGYGSTLNAYNFDSGYKSISCETPTQIDYLDPKCRFTTTTGLIGYTIVKTFIVNTIMDMVGKRRMNNVGFNDISTNHDNSLYDICLSIPNGGTFTLGVFEDVENDRNYKYMEDLPKYPNGKTRKGILMIYRSSAYNSGSGWLRYVTMGDNPQDKGDVFINTFSRGAMRQWRKMNPNLKSSLEDVDSNFKKATVSIEDLVKKLDIGETLNLYLTPNFTKIKSQLPTEVNANYSLLNVVKAGKATTKIELTTFIEDFKKYLNYTNSNGLHTWKEITQ